MGLERVGYYHSVETFGTVDGPGIRYVLFLQGCPMRCLYCHNPDTWACEGGKPITVGEVLEDYEKYWAFLEGGGLTLSGGESLLQMDFAIDLFEAAKAKGIHTCLDTSGITFNPKSMTNLEQFDRLMAATDLVMLDIKELGDEDHIKLTGHSNQNILAFLAYLNQINKPVWIRHVILPDFTYKKDKLLGLGIELSKYSNIKAVDILPYHDLGKSKYKDLNIDYPLDHVESMTGAQATSARNLVLYAMTEPKKARDYLAKKDIANESTKATL